MMSLLLTLLVSVTAVRSLTFMDESEYGVSNVADLITVVPKRQKRSAVGLPGSLSFQFKLDDSIITLNLTRSARGIKSTPVYVRHKGRTTLQENVPMNKNMAVYQDPSRGSALIVSLTTNGTYQTAGTFHHKDQLFKIWPQRHQVDKRNTGSMSNIHQLRPVKHYDLSHDARAVPSDAFPSQRARRTASSLHMNTSSDDVFLHRQRRQVTEYTLELGLFSDFSDYSFFLTEAGNDATAALSLMMIYYAFIEESIQLRYDTVNQQDATITITTWTKFLNVATTPADSPWTEIIKTGTLVEDDASLNLFSNFITTSGASGTADHYMAFTRLNLQDNGNTNVAGIANLNAVCLDIGTSLNENTFDGFTGAIAAHELGHSLSARHDSLVGCNDADNFVMTAILNFPSLPNPSNLWTFSTCSVASIKNYLTSSQAACTLTTDLTGSNLPTNGLRAGQVTNADAQCARIVGTGSKFCRTSYQTGTLFDAMCQTLFCSGTDGNVDACSVELASEQTSCGSMKWCERGVCVSSSAAPATATNCPQGDDPTFNCQVGQCASYTASELLLCCVTCMTTTTTTTTTTITTPTTSTTTTVPTTTSATTTPPTSTTTMTTSRTTSTTTATITTTPTTTATPTASASSTSSTSSATSFSTTTTPPTATTTDNQSSTTSPSFIPVTTVVRFIILTAVRPPFFG